MKYDIKIIGGTIIDGDKTPRYKGDVGIKDGKIVALGKAEGDADKIISTPQGLSSARGLWIVTPTMTPRSSGTG